MTMRWAFGDAQADIAIAILAVFPCKAIVGHGFAEGLDVAVANACPLGPCLPGGEKRRRRSPRVWIALAALFKPKRKTVLYREVVGGCVFDVIRRVEPALLPVKASFDHPL